ncbi:MAG: 50S ribosomal protein L16 [Planctomycetes bacterium DG_23]|nr:MAG: 50S ribosomal protein L16 [Planctomycetes bacterium DG_23]
MPLMPKRTKFRKSQRGSIRGKATRGNSVAFGEYGLQALEAAWITDRQIEAGRVAATHSMAREGKLWIRIFPDKPVSKKPAETRMGTGKGEPDHWVAVVKPGNILYEISGVDEEFARECLARTAHKMPIRVRFVRRGHKV